MTPARQPHPQRCETCENKSCEYWEIHPHMSARHDQDTGWTASPGVITFAVGCATHTSAPAPAFKRCCDSCINVPCKVLNRIPCLAQEKQENICEENGCTDIENCDEICKHSRLFSPLQMQETKEQAAKAAREQVLGLARDMYGLMMCVEKINTDEFMEYYAERMKGLKEQYESLRAQQEQRK